MMDLAVKKSILHQDNNGLTYLQIYLNLSECFKEHPSLMYIRQFIYRHKKFLTSQQEFQCDQTRIIKLTMTAKTLIRVPNITLYILYTYHYLIFLIIKYFNEITLGFVTGKTLSLKISAILGYSISKSTISNYRYSLGNLY